MSNEPESAAAAGKAGERGEPEFTIGVEEEFQIVDAETRELSQSVERVLPAAQAALGEQVISELRPSMVETETSVCSSLGELRDELTRHRRELAAAAQREGTHIAAGGTHPFAEAGQQAITDRQRYQPWSFEWPTPA